MSRYNTPISNTITITRGSDHAVGQFVQVSDSRFADSEKDEQGEGYVLDWDKLFGFGTNLIKAELKDLHDDDRLKLLTNNFCKTL